MSTPGRLETNFPVPLSSSALACVVVLQPTRRWIPNWQQIANRLPDTSPILILYLAAPRYVDRDRDCGASARCAFPSTEGGAYYLPTQAFLVTQSPAALGAVSTLWALAITTGQLDSVGSFQSPNASVTQKEYNRSL